jgi:SAM-dependent MidA family methyltransferase
MEAALYEPGAGYYRRPAERIGYSGGADFHTASSSPLFGRLVAAACEGLLGAGGAAGHAFVEIGAEAGRGILDGVSHGFRSVRLVGLDDPLRIDGPAVVFSNELLDAQPFRRFRRSAGAWRELGVSVGPEGLCEAEFPPRPPHPAWLPEPAPEGYVIDAPRRAAELVRRIASEPWHGLFLAFDYGKSWEEIAHAAPEGTARAYRRHSRARDLLACPGEQDLTCHVCWDWISEALGEHGFGPRTLDSQEAFFVRHASAFIADLAQREAGRLSRDKQSLLQLLHPAHMGQKFQAMHTFRPAPAAA